MKLWYGKLSMFAAAIGGARTVQPEL